jgi:hypothetical protein
MGSSEQTCAALTATDRVGVLDLPGVGAVDVSVAGTETIGTEDFQKVSQTK